LSSKPNPLLEPSPYENDADELIGRHPKDLSKADLEAAGLEKRVGLKAIRAKCLACCEHNHNPQIPPGLDGMYLTIPTAIYFQ